MQFDTETLTTVWDKGKKTQLINQRRAHLTQLEYIREWYP